MMRVDSSGDRPPLPVGVSTDSASPEGRLDGAESEQPAKSVIARLKARTRMVLESGDHVVAREIMKSTIKSLRCVPDPKPLS